MAQSKDEKKDMKALTKISDKALLPMEISSELVKSLGELYNPIFSNIRIYGTVQDPLFVAKDVQKLLQLTTLSYSGDRFDEEYEKRKIRIQTNGGAQETVVFTEQGLYKAIFASVVPVAKQFQRYITLIMRRLRTTGLVTIDQSVADYKKDLEREKEKNKLLESQIDEEHAELLRHKAAEERYYNQWLDLQYKAATLDQKVKHAITKDAAALETQLQKMREKYMKPVYITLIKPPKEVEGEYYYDYEVDDPNEDDNCVYALSLQKENKSGQVVATAYIHKDTTLDTVHKKLHEMELAVKKKNDVSYANAYETSIDELQRIINSMMEL